MAVIVVSVILLAAVVLLVSEWLPVDVTAIGIMVALALTGILSPAEVVAGFANPAPITVGLLLVVARGLTRSGALDQLTDLVVRSSQGSGKRLLLVSLLLVGGLSSVINNTPVVVLFTSIVMAVCGSYGLSPSKFLMPISFISILAGTCTLIGTSTNILISDLAAGAGLAPIGMFELSIIGAPIAIAGGVYLFFASPRLLKAHREPVMEMRDEEHHRFISELQVQEGSALVGLRLGAGVADTLPDVEVFELLRDDRILDPLQDEATLISGDVLLVKASAAELVRILDSRLAVLPSGDEGGTIANPYEEGSLIVELVVSPGATVVGQPVALVLEDFDAHIHLLGVKRRRLHYSARTVEGLRLAVGDILLVQAPADHLEQIRAGGDFIVVEDLVHTLVNRRKAPLAITIFVAMVALATFGILDIMVASMAAVLLLLLTRCLTMRGAYRAIDGRVLLLIIGTLALGAALAKTGAADLYAGVFLTPFVDAGPQLVLSAFILVTSLLSLVLSNNATAVLLVPVALSTAAALGVDPRPFIIGICFGASACYASPLGYQTNLLVYGPGGYRVQDYLRLGLPLNLLVWAAASLLIPLFWQF